MFVALPFHLEMQSVSHPKIMQIHKSDIEDGIRMAAKAHLSEMEKTG